MSETIREEVHLNSAFRGEKGASSAMFRSWRLGIKADLWNIRIWILEITRDHLVLALTEEILCID